MFDLSFLNNISAFFLLQDFGLNFLDLIIIAVLLFYLYEGYALGFIAALSDFFSFVLSFILGLKFYSFFGQIIFNNFSIPIGFSNAIGFFVAAAISEIVLNIIFKKLLRIIVSSLDPGVLFKKIDRMLGIIPGAASALILLSFFLTLIISLPLSPYLKKAVSESKFGSVLVANTVLFEKSINSVFGQAVNETLNFLTVKPQSDEFVSLKFKINNVSANSQAEKEMFEAVNRERVSRGLFSLEFNDTIRDVARLHSQDMFQRGYFSHYTPENLSPFDRMAEGNIIFGTAGENLALAPSVDLAMQGLMNSPGHKANILSPDYKKIGIGVMDGGIYGLMFTQNFTD